MNLYITCIVCVTLIICCYLLYKHNLPKHYDKLINEKKEILRNLDNDITNKTQFIKNIDDNDVQKILNKLDFLEFKLENKNGWSIFIVLLLCISTGLILYYTYRWTYLISPDTIKKTADNLNESLNDILNSYFH